MVACPADGSLLSLALGLLLVAVVLVIVGPTNGSLFSLAEVLGKARALHGVNILDGTEVLNRAKVRTKALRPRPGSLGLEC